MNRKKRRLSNGFWHKFIPNSSKLISPQNIKFEIWDLEKHKIIQKWHPEIFCVQNCTFNQDASQFLLTGGCNAYESLFKIYHSETFETVAEFWLPEKAKNAVFKDDSFIVGTLMGNVYQIGINDALIYDKQTTEIDRKVHEEYKMSSRNNNKLFQIKESMIMFTEMDKTNNRIFLNVRPLKNNQNHQPNYVLMYDLKNKEQQELHLAFEDDAKEISGIKYSQGKLAILTSTFIKSGLRIADLYLYDLDNNTHGLIKSNFEITDIFSNEQCMSWHSKDKLAVIGLQEVVIINMKNKEEDAIAFKNPTAVEFSANATSIAIGGDKAIIYHL